MGASRINFLFGESVPDYDVIYQRGCPCVCWNTLLITF